MAQQLPQLKRIFDFAVVVIAAPIWIPAMAVTAVTILLTSGWPVLYLSQRYVLKGCRYRTIVKFRAMVKDAEKIANRDTVQAETNKLLNIVINSKLYTPLGQTLEKIHFTELPQLLQVLAGTLTLVGNRPMPENMLKIGKSVYPYIDERFSIPCGITGPAQLSGRDKLTDTERLKLEITYVYWCQEAYSPLTDLSFLLITVLLPLGLYRHPTMSQIEDILFKRTNQNKITLIRKRVANLMQTPASGHE